MDSAESLAAVSKVMKRAEKSILAANLTDEQSAIVINMLADVVMEAVNIAVQQTSKAIVEYAKQRLDKVPDKPNKPNEPDEKWYGRDY